MRKTLLSLAAFLTAALSWASGDVFTVSGDGDWETLCSSPEQYTDATVTLAADIKVSTSFPGTFCGTFDGQGHKVIYSDLRPTAEFALFNTLGEGAALKDFTVEGSIVSLHRTAGVALNVTGSTTMENIKVNADITSSGYPVGGFVAKSTSSPSFVDCEFGGSILCRANASADCAGFISTMSGASSFRFERCAFTGKIELSNATGTVAGWRSAGFVSTNSSTLVADCEFTNCLMSGEILQANGSERTGGLIGSPDTDKSSYIMKGCLITGTNKRWNSNNDPTWITQESCIVMGCGNWKKMGSRTMITNCYYTASTEVTQSGISGYTLADDALLAGGGLCFGLNGDQSDIAWYQTLGTDALPTLDSTHGQVYANGRKHCDGTDYEGVAYSNEKNGEVETDAHNFVDGVCDYCGEVPVEDGFLVIGSKKAWDVWVSKLKNGALTTSAKLTCDLEITEKLPDGFSGTFDGQGHTIDITLGAESGKYALFGNPSSSVIRNLVITGEVTGESNTAPVASYVKGELLLENVITNVVVTQTTLKDGNCSGMVGNAENNVTFRNCISASTVKATKDAGGFVGWAGGKTINMDNCAMIGDVTVNQGASSVFLRIRHGDCIVTMKNCYYVPCTPTILSGNGTNMAVTATQVDPNDVTSGSLCYTLNGDQSNIVFYQNLPGDEMPTVNSTHGQVYANGRKHCDGTDYDDVVYSNEKGAVETDAHNYDNGVCDYCGTLLLNDDGIFEINDDRTLAAFARAVNAGDYGLSAIMTKDVSVTMGGLGSECEMIGITQPYSGTFDGQGHTLTATVDGNGSEAGVFAKAGNAVISNLTVDGEVRNGTQAGFIGNNSTGTVAISNVVINLDIEGKLNVGGICGNSSNSGKAFTIDNVMFAGKVKYVGTAGQNGIGGFVGWAYDTKFVMNNSIMIGDIDLGTGTIPAQMLRVRSTCTISSKDCALIPVDGIKYINGNNAEMDATPTVCESADDGSVAYAANGSSWQNPVWFQNVGEDAAPSLDTDKGVVYLAVDGYASKTKDGYADMAADLVAEAETYTDAGEHPAQKSLVEEYMEAVRILESVSSFDELVAAYYPTVADQRKQVEASVATYAKLVAKVESTRQYIEDNAADFKGGPAYQKLEAYLSDNITEPAEDEFPNGSYAYIIDPENLLLDEAGITAEIAFIDQMLNEALNEGLNPGADATSFIVNADFSDGLNGWEGDKTGSVVKGETIGLHAVEHWTNKAFDLYQTVTLPENGIYEVVMNGAYRVGGYVDSRMHSAMLYMNGNQTFLRSTYEDIIPVDEAQDKVNCWVTGDVADYEVTDELGQVIGYLPHGVQSAAYAFNAGRYENRLVVNVTDNTLRIGVKNAHAVYPYYDWTDIANFRLRYLGTMEEVGETMDATVQSMCDMAQFIFDTEADELEYRKYPNYYNGLKNELKQLIADGKAATTAEDKYNVVCKMGELFGNIYECQKNYATLVAYTDAMAAATDKLSTSGIITSEEADDAYSKIYDSQSGYNDGKYTSEEAANGGDLSAISFYPTTDEDGCLKITDSKNLNVFAALVTTGMTDLNAVLANDVTADESFMMIGGQTNGTYYKYNGTFDGQGHTLTVDIKTSEDYTGVFRHTANATIRNVKFAGVVEGANNTGLVGQIDGGTRFENVESNLSILGGNNVGGFAGIAGNGPQYFNNCLFSGRVEAYTNGAGGYYGWSSVNKVYADNCLSIGEVVGDQAAYFFRVKCDGTVGTAGDAGCYVYGGNMYFLRTSAPEVLVSGTPQWWGEFLTDVILEVSEADLKSGKVCFDLNAGNEETPAWRQTLGEDSTPLLNSDHLQVFCFDGVYSNANDPDGISGIEPAAQGKDAEWYDLSGRRVQRPGKGLYIVGGRKVLVK